MAFTQSKLFPVAMGVSLLVAGPAWAADDSDTKNSAAEHSAAMDKGMTHDEAAASTRSKSKKMKGHGSAAMHSKAMQKGMTHDQATTATESSGTGSSPAATHSKAMNEGKTHDQATESTNK